MDKINYDCLIKNFLNDKGKVIAYPAKRKMKIYTLYYLAEKIDSDVVYSESDFNDLLDCWHTFHDPATLRRELISYGFISRERDGSCYRKYETAPIINL